MNKNNIFILSILIICVIAQLSLFLGMDWLQFARSDIEAGQWWRFISANFVHLNWRHFAMNAVALVAIYALYPNVMNNMGWLLAFLLNSLAVTVGLWLFSPLIQWYVGLSGVLHGILTMLILLDYVLSKSKLNILLLLVLVTKLIWEGLMGPLPGSETTAGGPIVVQAHLYGFLGGLLLAVCILQFTTKNKKLQT